MMHAHFEKYNDGWLWIIVSNGRVLAMSGCYYKHLSHCKRAFRKIIRGKFAPEN